MSKNNIRYKSLEEKYSSKKLKFIDDLLYNDENISHSRYILESILLFLNEKYKEKCLDLIIKYISKI